MSTPPVTRAVTWPDPQVGADLDALRRTAPLVHLHTNPVALALSANVLTAIGAIPAARAIVEQPDDPRGVPDAVLVNLGVRAPERVEVWRAAARAAAADGVPWVLDPIGANSPYPAARSIARELLGLGPAVLRANASETAALAGLPLSGRGPDSEELAVAETAAAAAAVARASAPATAVARAAAPALSAVAVTGATDLVTDGHQVVLVPGGHPWMPRVSALGCALGALVAAFTAVSPTQLDAAVAASVVFAEAGARAADRAGGPGTLVPHLIDVLYSLQP